MWKHLGFSWNSWFYSYFIYYNLVMNVKIAMFKLHIFHYHAFSSIIHTTWWINSCGSITDFFPPFFPWKSEKKKYQTQLFLYLNGHHLYLRLSIIPDFNMKDIANHRLSWMNYCYTNSKAQCSEERITNLSHLQRSESSISLY